MFRELEEGGGGESWETKRFGKKNKEKGIGEGRGGRIAEKKLEES